MILSIEFSLTLLLMESNVISLCHGYRARPAWTSMQSDQALYCWQTIFKFLILISLKIVIDSSYNGRWIISFNIFSWWRVKQINHIVIMWSHLQVLYLGDNLIVCLHNKDIYYKTTPILSDDSWRFTIHGLYK